MSKPLSTPEMLGSVDELYRRFAPTGRRYAMSMLRNEADSEEIVQEAFLRITRSHEDWVERHWSDIDTMDVEGFLKARMFTAIRNLCIDRSRARKRQRLVSLESVGEQASRNGSGNIDGPKELLVEVERLLEQMNSNWAEALRLKQNGELSYQQIALVLSSAEGQVSHAQVRTWIFRGRRFLEQELTKSGLIGNQ